MIVELTILLLVFLLTDVYEAVPVAEQSVYPALGDALHHLAAHREDALLCVSLQSSR